jgi:hypothetical protein
MTYWDDHATYRRAQVGPIAGWSHDWRRHALFDLGDSHRGTEPSRYSG